MGSYSLIIIAHASSGNIEIHPVLNFVFFIFLEHLSSNCHSSRVSRVSLHFPVKSWAMSEWRFLPHIIQVYNNNMLSSTRIKELDHKLDLLSFIIIGFGMIIDLSRIILRIELPPPHSKILEKI